ncbi:MAG TPA: hypothetical protein VL326_17325 [Kofleriaceae bacterium]|jgi:hypothetical protein|nr:hypothetical protein [Kofleriaceae bacterium]
MTWPFSEGGGLLALYLATLALHAVFIGYVVAGTAFVLFRRHDPMAATVRDRLPFMLGAGITAGVAPLLFIQLLYQHRFYTANLLLGPRWLAVVPVLIVGFYGLYIQKVSDKWRRPAQMVALACFVFVGWSWSELHELMKADPAWHDFYAAGQRVYFAGSIAPRAAVLFPAMATSFAMIAAWSANGDARQRLALLAIGSRFVSIGGAVWLWRGGFTVDGAAFAWFLVLAAAVVVEIVAWALTWRAPTDGRLAVATAAGTSALVAATVVREAPRIPLLEPAREIADQAGGSLVFAAAFVIGGLAIAWVIKTAREA